MILKLLVLIPWQAVQALSFFILFLILGWLNLMTILVYTLVAVIASAAVFIALLYKDPAAKKKDPK